MHAPSPACYHAAVMKPRHLLRRLGRILPRALRLLLLRRYMARHHYPCADTWAPGEAGEFSFTNASEQTPLRLRGWVHRPAGQPAGTVFLLHGFLSCAAAKIKEARLFARECSLVCVAWDARAHGNSDAAVPTFGPQEVGDVSAALEKAAAMGLPRPFILYGTSMGGMVARCAARCLPQIAGVITSHAPGSLRDLLELPPMTPTERVLLQDVLLCGEYGCEIEDCGDPANMPVQHGCKPFVLAISGEKDCYCEERMRAAFLTWPGEKAYNVFPGETKARCIRYVFPHTGHPGGPDPVSYEQPEYPRLLKEAIARILDEHKCR